MRRTTPALRRTPRQRKSRVDDVLSFFATPAARDGVGLNERAVEVGSGSHEAGEEVDVIGARPTVTRLTSDAQIATAIASVYDPFVYAYCLFDHVTIQEAVHEMTQRQSSPRSLAPLLSPYALVRHPRSTLRRIGPAHTATLAAALHALLAAHDTGPRHSLAQCVIQFLGAEAVWPATLPDTTEIPVTVTVHTAEETAPQSTPVPQLAPTANMISFLRGLLLCSATNDPLTVQASFVLDALLRDGEVANTTLMLPGDRDDRAVALADMMREGSVEFGSEAMLNAALLLMRQSGQEVSLRTCKEVCLGQWQAERRALDWTYKSSALLSRRKAKSPRKRGVAPEH